MPTDLYRLTLKAERVGHSGLADAYLTVIIALMTVLLVATWQLSLTDSQDKGNVGGATVVIGP